LQGALVQIAQRWPVTDLRDSTTSTILELDSSTNTSVSLILVLKANKTGLWALCQRREIRISNSFKQDIDFRFPDALISRLVSESERDNPLLLPKSIFLEDIVQSCRDHNRVTLTGSLLFDFAIRIARHCMYWTGVFFK
jgi:hypothetical protein